MAVPGNQHNPSTKTDSQQRTSNETVKLVRKLRWIGMEDEAERVLNEMSDKDGAAEDCVLATPRDTD